MQVQQKLGLTHLFSGKPRFSVQIQEEELSCGRAEIPEPGGSNSVLSDTTATSTAGLQFAKTGIQKLSKNKPPRDRFEKLERAVV